MEFSDLRRMGRRKSLQWRHKEGGNIQVSKPIERFAPMPVSRLLIIFGLVLVTLGVLWPLIIKLGLGRLPGDIVIERENFRVYVPITTSLLISAVVSLILWLVNR
jgi:hypothetical protein